MIIAALNNCRIQGYIISSIINYNQIKDNNISTNLMRENIEDIITDVISLFKSEFHLKHISIEV